MDRLAVRCLDRRADLRLQRSLRGQPLQDLLHWLEVDSSERRGLRPFTLRIYKPQEVLRYDCRPPAKLQFFLSSNTSLAFLKNLAWTSTPRAKIRGSAVAACLQLNHRTKLCSQQRMLKEKLEACLAARSYSAILIEGVARQPSPDARVARCGLEDCWSDSRGEGDQPRGAGRSLDASWSQLSAVASSGCNEQPSLDRSLEAYLRLMHREAQAHPAQTCENRDPRIEKRPSRRSVFSLQRASEEPGPYHRLSQKKRYTSSNQDSLIFNTHKVEGVFGRRSRNSSTNSTAGKPLQTASANSSIRQTGRRARARADLQQEPSKIFHLAVPRLPSCKTSVYLDSCAVASLKHSCSGLVRPAKLCPFISRDGEAAGPSRSGPKLPVITVAGNSRERQVRISSKGAGGVTILAPSSFLDRRKLEEVKSRLQASPYLAKYN